METIGTVLGTIFLLAIFGWISGFCGWEILKDKDWFWRLHKDSRIRQTLIIALLSTIGIPFICGFIAIGSIMLICIDSYEFIRYGKTTDCG